MCLSFSIGLLLPSQYYAFIHSSMSHL